MANLQKFGERVQKLFDRYPGEKQIIARSYVSTINRLNARIREAHISFEQISSLTGISVSAISRILSLCYVPRADFFDTIALTVAFLWRDYLEGLSSQIDKID